jgi:integrin alpha FG-GAP repeat containing protein 1
MDIVFPTCGRHSSGKGEKCQINIAYNQQVSICTGESSKYSQDGKLSCRGWGELCVADDGFEFTFDTENEVCQNLFHSLGLTAYNA